MIVVPVPILRSKRDDDVDDGQEPADERLNEMRSIVPQHVIGLVVNDCYVNVKRVAEEPQRHRDGQILKPDSLNGVGMFCRDEKKGKGRLFVP